MKKESLKFSVYGNCQSYPLALTLLRNKKFQSLYNYSRIPFVHTLNTDQIELIEDTFKCSDLILYQNISKNYKIKELATERLLKLKKKDATILSYPSLYFNAYSPHYDSLEGVQSILGGQHDYIIMLCFLKGMTIKETLKLLQDKDLYTKDISMMLYENAIRDLKNREENIDIQVSYFIEKNFQKEKLFNQYNHPGGKIFEHISQFILKSLDIDSNDNNESDKDGIDRVIVPVLKSTYNNLKLEFKEDFNNFKINDEVKSLEDVVTSFFETYKNLDKIFLYDKLYQKKPFILEMFSAHTI